MAILRVLMMRSDPRLLLRKAVWDVLQRQDADVNVNELLAAARAAAGSARSGAEAADEDEAEEEEGGDFDEEPLPEELDSMEEQRGECVAPLLLHEARVVHASAYSLPFFQHNSLFSSKYCQTVA